MDKLIFLFAAFFLVWGLRLQSSPESATRGNKYAALGMFLSIFGAIIMPFENSGFNNNFNYFKYNNQDTYLCFKNSRSI